MVRFGHCTFSSASSDRGLCRHWPWPWVAYVPQSAAVVGLVTVTLKLAPGARLAMSQSRTLLTIVHSALSGSRPTGSRAAG